MTMLCCLCHPVIRGNLSSTNKKRYLEHTRTKLYRVAAPIYSIEISDAEREQAAQTRKDFESLTEIMNEAFEHLFILSDALNGVTETSQFVSMSKLFLRYTRKIRKLFNNFIKQLEKCLLALNKTVTDARMVKIRDTIVGEVREIRDGILEVLDILNEPDSKDFVQNFRTIVERLGQRSDSLEEVITDQLFSHLDEDILGHIRLGTVSDKFTKIGDISCRFLNIPLRK